MATGLLMKTPIRLFVGPLLALVAGLVMFPTARAATLVDIRVDSISGSGSFTNKTATIHEGDTVTVGIYLSYFEDAAGNSNGLGAYFISIRSFGELFDNPGAPTAFSGGPTATTTVLNATTCADHSGTI